MLLMLLWCVQGEQLDAQDVTIRELRKKLNMA
jgi:hypothetical protein